MLYVNSLRNVKENQVFSLLDERDKLQVCLANVNNAVVTPVGKISYLPYVDTNLEQWVYIHGLTANMEPQFITTIINRDSGVSHIGFSEGCTLCGDNFIRQSVMLDDNGSSADCKNCLG